jgi:hypothetical protein
MVNTKFMQAIIIIIIIIIITEMCLNLLLELCFDSFLF